MRPWVDGAGTIDAESTLSIAGPVSTEAVMSFAGVGGQLDVAADGSLLGTITGFAQGDTVDFANLAYDAVTLATGNVLQIVNSYNVTDDIRLDPNASYAGDSFGLVSDGNAGSDLTLFVTRRAACR